MVLKTFRNCKIIFIFLLFLISSCGGNKKDNFDFSDFKMPVKKSINSEITSSEITSSENTNSNPIQYELKPLKEREEIISSIKFEKNDPFLFDSQSSNELSDIKLKGFITISNKNYAVVDYLDNEGYVTTQSIGGKNTNLLPRGAFIKEINPSKRFISITYLDEIFVISFEG